ncbi:hypothetical protein CYY_002284 [Polysphondylium violaceum]|uniref:Ankyrin repeat-containing protein n=1 Tax=Polysphondylium violaceum TaxID=133409 RepID=A0A8J4V725_9MYCE|nr:hypothetical protein CYY_002284 [Polysphondylium violaceum]
MDVNRELIFFRVFKDKLLLKNIFYYIHHNINGGSNFINLSLKKSWAINVDLFYEKIDLYFNVWKKDPSTPYYLDIGMDDIQFLLEEPKIPQKTFELLFNEFGNLFHLYDAASETGVVKQEPTPFSLLYRTSLPNPPKEKPSIRVLLLAVQSGSLEKVQFLEAHGFSFKAYRLNLIIESIENSIGSKTFSKELLDYILSNSNVVRTFPSTPVSTFSTFSTFSTTPTFPVDSSNLFGAKVGPIEEDQNLVTVALKRMFKSREIEEWMASAFFNSFLCPIFYSRELVSAITEHGFYDLAVDWVKNSQGRDIKYDHMATFVLSKPNCVKTYQFLLDQGVFKDTKDGYSLGKSKIPMDLFPFFDVTSSFEVFEYYLESSEFNNPLAGSINTKSFSNLYAIFDSRVKELLMRKQVKLQNDYRFGNLMDQAAVNGSFEMVKWLHEMGFSCTKSATNSTLEIVEFLIENTTQGFTDTHLTNCYHGDLRIVELLHETTLKRPDYPITFSYRSIDRCAMHGYLDIVQYLLKHRKEGFTRDGLNDAVKGGHVEIVKLLLSFNEKFTLFESSMDQIILKGHTKMFEFLLTTKYAPLLLNHIKGFSQTISQYQRNKFEYYINPHNLLYKVDADHVQILVDQANYDDLMQGNRMHIYTHAASKGLLKESKMGMSEIVEAFIQKLSILQQECNFFLYTLLYNSPYSQAIKNRTLLHLLYQCAKNNDIRALDYIAANVTQSSIPIAPINLGGIREYTDEIGKLKTNTTLSPTTRQYLSLLGVI